MAKTTTAKTAAADTSKTCACGCGAPVERRFKQGHDQRLVSNLASDLVHADVWDGKCMGILKGAAVRADIQERINTVTRYVRENLTDALATKVYNAAMRAWELEKTRDEKAAAKEAKRKAAADKPKRERKSGKATPSEEAGDAPAARKLITKATASNDDVDAAEAEMDDNTAGGLALGSGIRVLIGKRKRNAKVHGMNQAGKVTAIALTTNGKETVRTEGFTVLGHPA